MTLAITEGTGGSIAQGAADPTWAWDNAGLALAADDILVLVFAGVGDGSGYGVAMYDSAPPSDVGSDTWTDGTYAQMRYGVGAASLIGLQVWTLRISATHTAGSVSGSAYWRRQLGGSASSTDADAWGWWRVYRVRGLGGDDDLRVLSALGNGSLTSPGDAPGEFSRDLGSRTADSVALAWALAQKTERFVDPPVGFIGLAEGDSEGFDSFDDDFTTLGSPPLAATYSWAVGFARGTLDDADSDAIFHVDNSGGGTTWTGTKWAEALLEFSAVPEPDHGLSTYIGISFPEEPR